jgi:MoaA/NifB/PqqE/SkfB family radical SAM enzyme
MRFITGLAKLCLYARIALHVAGRYLVRMPPRAYPGFLRRALILLLNFWPNKAVRLACGYKIYIYLPAYPSAAFFRALEAKLRQSPPGPVSAVYSMTKACAYHCPHCYQRQDAGADVSEDLLIATALAMKQRGVAFLNIEGGEPFLRFERLLHLVRAAAPETEIWVNTTGDQVTPEKLQALRDAGLHGIMVSLHAAGAAAHDAFTGVAGAFETAGRTLRLGRALRLGAAINSVLSEADIRGGQLDALMATARALDCDFVQLIHPKPAGRWLENPAALQVDDGYLAALRATHLQYNSRRRRDWPVLAAQVFEERPEGLGCTAGGVDRFYVNAAGEVQPCEFLNISFGNVRSEPFDVIFDRMRAAFAAPTREWPCCTRTHTIAALLRRHELATTPLPAEYVGEFLADWKRGEQPEVYRRMRLYP